MYTLYIALKESNDREVWMDGSGETLDIAMQNLTERLLDLYADDDSEWRLPDVASFWYVKDDGDDVFLDSTEFTKDVQGRISEIEENSMSTNDMIKEWGTWN